MLKHILPTLAYRCNMTSDMHSTQTHKHTHTPKMWQQHQALSNYARTRLILSAFNVTATLTLRTMCPERHTLQFIDCPRCDWPSKIIANLPALSHHIYATQDKTQVGHCTNKPSSYWNVSFSNMIETLASTQPPSTHTHRHRHTHTHTHQLALTVQGHTVQGPNKLNRKRAQILHLRSCVSQSKYAMLCP